MRFGAGRIEKDITLSNLEVVLFDEDKIIETLIPGARYKSATLKKLAAQALLKTAKMPEELNPTQELTTWKELKAVSECGEANGKGKIKRKRKRQTTKNIARRHSDVTRDVSKNLRLIDEKLIKEQQWVSASYAWNLHGLLHEESKCLRSVKNKDEIYVWTSLSGDVTHVARNEVPA